MINRTGIFVWMLSMIGLVFGGLLIAEIVDNDAELFKGLVAIILIMASSILINHLDSIDEYFSEGTK